MCLTMEVSGTSYADFLAAHTVVGKITAKRKECNCAIGKKSGASFFCTLFSVSLIQPFYSLCFYYKLC